ncbi:hypothetical protein GGTG_11595 [Gaeumannomyces tritici R3-111a-1]|uniref:Uncharacterized protein n=1 Tax=Gaeumannomyces tritici (strain R3-111a-1) TaxID=644352 RepID=J3PDM2_GAET3|nr:hypothetical protein GGTG_11595 [Gaeumannomyces tritici R3-111a-1]EJT70572.1 hypothetical protein GGTG_11595 [Gaeumannomyces tritici R3-111a-1]
MAARCFDVVPVMMAICGDGPRTKAVSACEHCVAGDAQEGFAGRGELDAQKQKCAAGSAICSASAPRWFFPCHSPRNGRSKGRLAASPACLSVWIPRGQPGWSGGEGGARLTFVGRSGLEKPRDAVVSR